MKIDQNASVSLANTVKKKARSSIGGFGDLITASTDMAESTTSAQAPTPLQSVLMMQEVVSDEKATQQVGIQHGKSMIELLKDLQLQLISGHVQRDDLIRLQYGMATLRSQVREYRLSFAHMAALKEVLDEIEIRIDVEIAKFNLKEKA